MTSQPISSGGSVPAVTVTSIAPANNSISPKNRPRFSPGPNSPAANTSTASVTTATVTTITVDRPSTRNVTAIPASSDADPAGRSAAAAHASARVTAAVAAPAAGATRFARIPATARPAPPASGTAGSGQAMPERARRHRDAVEHQLQPHHDHHDGLLGQHPVQADREQRRGEQEEQLEHHWPTPPRAGSAGGRRFRSSPNRS